MKSILSLLLCCCLGSAHAQVLDSLTFPVDPATHLITYSGTVPVAGVSQQELYTRAKLWFVGSFKTAKDVIKVDEKDAGIVVGTRWQNIYGKTVNVPVPYKLWYTVKIAVKDSRYKYEISGFLTEGYPSAYPMTHDPTPVEPFVLAEKTKVLYRGAVRHERKQLDAAAKEIALSIQTDMSKAAGISAGKSDW